MHNASAFLMLMVMGLAEMRWMKMVMNIISGAMSVLGVLPVLMIVGVTVRMGMAVRFAVVGVLVVMFVNMLVAVQVIVMMFAHGICLLVYVAVTF